MLGAERRETESGSGIGSGSVEQYLREGAAQHAAWRPCTTLKRGVRECEETGATQLIPSNRARTGEPQPTTSLLRPILATNNFHVPMYPSFCD